MIPQAFLADLEAKPAVLRDLAAQLDDPWAGLGAPPFAGRDRLVLLGMGSSAYAAGVVAARLRAAGVDATSVLASSDLLPAADSRALVVAVSAGGGSRETVAAVEHYAATGPVVLLTNTPSSSLAARCDLVVPMDAGEETGGVACRSFQHTLLLLLALANRLQPDAAVDVAQLARAAADASEDLLARRDVWLPRLRSLLLGPDGSSVVAPARRLSSAQQAALMLREGPRRAAVASETGDWSHVDVYLTKTLDYRMLLFAGSRWEDELLRWTTERGSTVVAVGGDVPGATEVLRYAGDGDDDVRLVSEVLVAELLAADAWLHP